MPERFGDYELIEKIATGGMAEIYLARTGGVEGFSRPVVVKKMLPQLAVRDDFVTMFLDEARLAANLAHPNVVQVFNLGEVDGSYYMAMELVDGPHLGALFAHSLRQRNPLPVELCVHSIARSADGLHYAHNLRDPATGLKLNIVHRDISPQNILVSRHGDVKVTDFGVAKADTQEAVTRTGIIKGKVAYMSPEQCLGEIVDNRTDVFALGVVLYELLTRRRLFRDKSDLLIMQRITTQNVAPPSSLNSAVDSELDEICARALARDREDRYESAAELSEALDVWTALGGYTDCRGKLARWIEEFAPELGLGIKAALLAHDADRTPSGVRELESSGTASTPALEARIQRENSDATLIVPQGQNAEAPLATADDGQPVGDPGAVNSALMTVAEGHAASDSPSLTEPSPPQHDTDSDAALAADGPETAGTLMPSGGTVQGNRKTGIAIGTSFALVLTVVAGVIGFGIGDDDSALSPEAIPTPATPSPATIAGNENRAEATAKLSVLTNPPGAQVFIDDKPVGASPFSGPVHAGARRVAALFGNKMVRRNVILKVEEEKSIRLVAPVSLLATSSPSSAAVRVDGVLVGETPLRAGRAYVEPGEKVTVRISHSGYYSETVVVTPTAGKPAVLSVNLRRVKEAGYGDVTVYSKPWTTVYVDGRKLGETPVAKRRVRSGRAVIRFVRSDLGISATKTVTVPKNGKIQINATFTNKNGRYRASINAK